MLGLAWGLALLLMGGHGVAVAQQPDPAFAPADPAQPAPDAIPLVEAPPAAAPTAPALQPTAGADGGWTSDAPAPTDGPTREGFQLGAVLGFAFCGGGPLCEETDESDDPDYPQYYTSGPGLGLEAGYRIAPIFAFGLQLRYQTIDVALDSELEDAGVNEASASYFGYGLYARLYPVSEGPWDPWLGASIGLLTFVDERVGEVDDMYDYYGDSTFDFVSTATFEATQIELSGGVDYWVAPQFAIGAQVVYVLNSYEEKYCVEVEGELADELDDPSECFTANDFEGDQEEAFKDGIDDLPDFYGIFVTGRLQF